MTAFSTGFMSGSYMQEMNQSVNSNNHYSLVYVIATAAQPYNFTVVIISSSKDFTGNKILIAKFGILNAYAEKIQKINYDSII